MNLLHYSNVLKQRSLYSSKKLSRCLTILVFTVLFLTLFVINNRRPSKTDDSAFHAMTNQCKAPYYNLKIDEVVLKQQEILSERFDNCTYLNGKPPLFYSSKRQEMTYSMDQEFDMIMELIQCNVPFAFTRWGDGEYFLVSGNSIPQGAQAETVDKWIWREDRIGVLGNVLIESLRMPIGLYFYGLPCPYTWNSALPGYLSIGRNITTAKMSYSMIWMGENYPKLYKFFRSIQTGNTTMKQKVVLVINQSGSHRLEELSSWASHVIFVPDNCAEIFEINTTRCAWISYVQSMARLHTDTLFMVSAGPLSEVLIYYMYLASPYTNQYIDFGSSLDDIGKGENTRGYSPDRYPSTRACPFIFGRNLTNQVDFDEKYCLLTESIEDKIPF